MDFFGRPKADAPAPSKTDKQSDAKDAAAARLVPWVEKYRPRNINEVTAQDEVVRVLRKSLETKNLPHLLFYGPPGTGKTSTILALTRDMYGAEAKTRVLELNASDERGISVIREKVKNFARGAIATSSAARSSMPPYKVIILDEADSMTSDAQAALRRIIEKYSRVTRFCLVCNYVSRIIEPLASRCTKFRFKSLPRDQAIARVAEVARLENVGCRDDAVGALVDCAEGDLRRAMMSLQSASRMVGSSGKQLDAAVVAEVVGVIPSDVVAQLRDSWGAADTSAVCGLVDQLVYSGYPASRVLSQLHDLVVDDERLSSLQKSKIAILMASTDKALHDGADEQLQLLDLMLQASKVAVQQAA